MVYGKPPQEPPLHDAPGDVWARAAALFPAPRAVGRPRRVDVRQVLAAIRFKLRSGCAWRALPPHFPPWQTVYGYHRTLVEAGVWPAVRHHLLKDPDGPGPERPPAERLTASGAAAVAGHAHAAASHAMTYTADARLALAVRKKFTARAAASLEEKRQWVRERLRGRP